MKQILKGISICLFLSIFFLSANFTTVTANVSVTYPFTDSMVVQRNIVLPIYGRAASGETVTVKFNNQTKSVITPSSGKWRVELDPMSEAGPLTMIITGNNTITLKDVYIGEVWNCAGQSNMDWRLSAYPHYADTIKKANNPLIRYIDVRFSLLGRNKGWHTSNPVNIGGCSATAYFFGKFVQEEVNCAVGLMVTAVGGTYVEGWLDPETIAENPGMILPQNLNTAGGQYNEFIAPVAGYGIKGTICMLGEQNAGDTLTAPLHGKRFMAMIEGWRKQWGQGDFPFYYGQITRFDSKASPDTLNPVILVREGQRMALSLPNTGMSVNLDLTSNGWHFNDKYEGGRRLALIALAKDYGQTDLEYSGPLYEKMEIEGNRIKLHFTNIGTGFKMKDITTPRCISVAGADNKWYPANLTTVSNNTILAGSSYVQSPVKACYALGSSPAYNIYNKEDLPASPFMTSFMTSLYGYEQRIAIDATNTKEMGDDDFSPASSDTNSPIVYESDNESVATITAEGKVHITGIGECNIKAYQLGNLSYRESLTLTQKLVVRDGNSIAQDFYEASIILYPNPISDNMLNIKLPANYTSDITLMIYDNAGRVLKKEIQKAHNHLQMNVSSLPQGLYILRLITENGQKNMPFIKR